MLPDTWKDTAYHIGVGLGNSSGQPAIVIVRRTNWETGERNHVDFSRRLLSRIEVCRIDRFAPDATHAEIAARAAEISRNSEISGKVAFVVDTTGDGAPFVRTMYRQNIGVCRILALCVAPGGAETHADNTYHVPKRSLLGGLLTTLDACQASYDQSQEPIVALQAELVAMRQAFRTGGLPALDQINPTDAAVAMAMAIWRARKFDFHV
ncbi:MAG: hypothetical protein JNK48_00610 [Bryobacterales bacterium]|nr:hypothetical protein [Bryobacterales bacterium]